jgi:hypothetical protein
MRSWRQTGGKLAAILWSLRSGCEPAFYTVAGCGGHDAEVQGPLEGATGSAAVAQHCSSWRTESLGSWWRWPGLRGQPGIVVCSHTDRCGMVHHGKGRKRLDDCACDGLYLRHGCEVVGRRCGCPHRLRASTLDCVVCSTISGGLGHGATAHTHW